MVRAKAESVQGKGDDESQQLNVDSAMAIDRRKAVVFGAAFALRLFLTCVFPSLPDLLTGRVEVSTPVNSFKRRTCLRSSPQPVN